MIVKSGSEKVLKTDGLYYSWDLPSDKHDPYTTQTLTHSNFFLFIKGKAQVQNPYQVSFNLFTRYAHLKNYTSLKPSFTWSIGSWPGVSFDMSNNPVTQYFYSYCYKSIP
jgi:hypothetical protein